MAPGRTVALAVTVLVAYVAVPAFGASLGSEVLAQVNQFGGYTENPDNFSVRVLQDGTIEELGNGQWQLLGKLALPPYFGSNA
jgi:hypothetical protein